MTSARTEVRSVLHLVIALVGLSPLAAPPASAVKRASAPSPWLAAHIGEGPDRSPRSS